ncbi:MAG: porin family protein [Gammaproteobacteria bacterium]|nr:porin family protein [Gammaproteobacteria bacterium]
MFGLVAAAFAFLVRRQRIAAVAVMGGLAVTAVMMAAPVQAGWYAGVGGGLTRGDFSSSTLEGQLVAKGYNTPPNAITSVSVDNTDSGWKIFGGYQFNRFLAAEVSRVNLGDTKSTVTGSLTTPPSDIPTLLNDASDAHGYLARGWTVAGVGIWPVKPTVSLFAKLGMFRWKADINITEISTGQSVSRDENGGNAMGGIGIKHMPNPKWELRAEIERYKVSSDWVDFLSLGVGYRF